MQGPFGQYATIVAAGVAFAVLAAWLTTVLGFAPSSPLLDSVALLIVGAIFGTGAGAAVVANGVAKSGDAANTRLDAIHAPSAAVAEQIVKDNNTP